MSKLGYKIVHRTLSIHINQYVKIEQLFLTIKGIFCVNPLFMVLFDHFQKYSHLIPLKPTLRGHLNPQHKWSTPVKQYSDPYFILLCCVV